jgi:hypothetical protein
VTAEDDRGNSGSATVALRFVNGVSVFLPVLSTR